MLQVSFVTVFLVFKSLFSSCQCHKTNEEHSRCRSYYKIKKTGHLPEYVTESSGIEYSEDSTFFYVHSDGGGETKLYQISLKGEVFKHIEIRGAANKDWEDITTDGKGNYFIGDFGNNSNVRKDLKIYKFNIHNNLTEAISFTYPDQKDFPPQESGMNFDCEAMVWEADSLYFFSKNRGGGPVKIYSLPDKPGSYIAGCVGELTLKGMVTAAAINHNRGKLALLTYGRVYFYDIVRKENKISFQLSSCQRFRRGLQTEAIVFLSEEDILITNEAGRIYKGTKKRGKF
ncbi:MAG: SdiA-regulated domain-containing protein [Cytophagaceae bacterium]